MPDVLLDINKRRYDAEAELARVKNAQIAHYLDAGKSATYARAQAEVEAQPQFKAWLNTKAEYHYAEALQKALTTKIYSMLNINKGLLVQYGSYR